MDQEMKIILQRLEKSVGKLEEGQTETHCKLDTMEKRFDSVDQNFVNVDKRFDVVDQKFVDVDKRFNAVDQKFVDVDKRFDAVDQKFVDVDNRFDAVDQKFADVDKRFDGVDSRLGHLETGQDELKDLLKHHTTLLTDNFTNIRQDLRRKGSETDSDINLLFRKTEKHERDIEKLKKNLNY